MGKRESVGMSLVTLGKILYAIDEAQRKGLKSLGLEKLEPEHKEMLEKLGFEVGFDVGSNQIPGPAIVFTIRW